MSKKSIYGKAKNTFYKVAEHSLNRIWDYKLEGYNEIDFVKQGGGNYILGENEIFFIKTRNEEIGDYLEHIINTSACNFITKSTLKDLATIYVFDRINDKIHLYIQRIMPTARIEKTYLSFNPDIKLAHIENKVNVVIYNYTHLYWNQETQKIYFTKFSDLEKVFPAFTIYYRDATKEDVKNFKDATKYPFLQVRITDFESLPKTKLKTIAMIVDELEKVKVKENFEEYKQYALKYKQSFVKNNKFEISDAKDIDHLADIVFRKFYTTEAGEEERRKVNSFRTLKSENE
ncbi:hypothetical protein [Helicobacter sp. MIT 05-5294]|uniref:hypothetical protein n=1 Tax=Helicobacter sp. MIT 05-5294 TaxID=1548150 RepID=UPI00051F8F87|nr:hypothetical protein [Helicobacter sp. MIT 05-5294]TLD86569.1 hypothetical protein LS69_006100 [Helicobacter sp. MIT 05-5294]